MPPGAPDLVIEALSHRLRNAGPWRDLPRELGPRQTIFGYYRQRTRPGLWNRILRNVAKPGRRAVRLVDGTHMVVCQGAVNPRGGAAAQAMGRTRGGRNTRRMAVADLSGRTL